MKKILGIIPSRYASSRFPAKALADIMGKPMIQRVYEQASKSSVLEKVIVATDDKRIFDVVESFGAEAIMTSEDHKSGTDRCAEALKKLGGDFDFIINIQGDEPFINPSQIDDIGKILENEVQLATLVKKISTTQNLLDVNACKAVIDQNNFALYFSRWPIPHVRDHGQEDWVRNHEFWEQVGIYAYRKDILEEITRLPQSPLEKAESLEQLRWMENGYKIKVGFTEYDSQCIDTPEDLEIILERLRSNRSLLS
jgi:3-deoxy-manno-octulosonate cytidylyltransferase (CMP-KDO synthetase)